MGQSQKYMAYIMPFFALSGLYWPFGLVLYWVTTNVWTLGQQWVLFRSTRSRHGRSGRGRTAGPSPGDRAPARPAAAPPSQPKARDIRPGWIGLSGGPGGQPDQGGSNGSGHEERQRRPGQERRPQGRWRPAPPESARRRPSRRRTAAGCCAGSASGPSPSRRRPSPRLSSSGSRSSGSPAASARESGENLAAERGPLSQHRSRGPNPVRRRPDREPRGERGHRPVRARSVPSRAGGGAGRLGLTHPGSGRGDGCGDDLDTPGAGPSMLMTPTARPARTAGRKRLRASPRRPGRRLTRTARARPISPTWNSKVR